MYCISPLDNRYFNKIQDVAEIFSDMNFAKSKLFVECEYIKAAHPLLCDGMTHRILTSTDIKFINSIYEKFDDSGYSRIKQIESATNHDVQALVQYCNEKFPENTRNFIHYGLTSQDINSPAMMLLYKSFNDKILLSSLNDTILKLLTFENLYKSVPMLTFTHGQPAMPSTFGLQMLVFYDKLKNIDSDIREFKYKTKFGGSNGNFTGLKYCYNNVDWNEFADTFIKNLGFTRNKYTTQIDNYSNYFKLFQIYERLCYILINMCQDMWLYCHRNYFKLSNIASEVGSSAMPHKINPIHFENAEGNLKLASSLFNTIGSNICVNRLQRDLTDSTILRNVGVACGHMILAIRSINTGLERISLNTDVIYKELNENKQVLMEVAQLLMRKWNIADGYNLCKEYSRGKNNIDMNEFVNYLREKQINLNRAQVQELSNLDFNNLF